MGQVELVEWIARPSSDALDLGPTSFEISVLYADAMRLLMILSAPLTPEILENQDWVTEKNRGHLTIRRVLLVVE